MEIQFSEEKKNKLSPSSVLRQVWGFQTFPSHFMPLCFWCVLCGDRFLCGRDARIFLITHLSQNQDKNMETSCHCDNVHTAELDSETGSLYSRGLKLINPCRKSTVCSEVSITEQNLTSQSKIITLTNFARKIRRLLYCYSAVVGALIFLCFRLTCHWMIIILIYTISIMECVWFSNVEIS